MDKRIPNGLTEKRALVLETALREVGTREATGKNDGAVVKYMPTWARSKGLPYCAWFVGWCFHQALGRYPYNEQHIGAVVQLYKAALVQREILLDNPTAWPSLQPQPGDIFVVLHEKYVANKAIPGHTGLVLRTDGDKINTVEGNFKNSVGLATRSLEDVTAVLNPWARLAAEEFSTVGWEHGLIDGLPLAGGLAATR